MTGADEAGAPPLYRLLLLVAGNSLRSRRAIENLLSICDNELRGNVDVQIIDISERPDLAQTYHVVAAPKLMRLLPCPIRHVVGDLSVRDCVLAGLELDATPVVADHWPLTDSV
jgi:circadian clock protein KaiB